MSNYGGESVDGEVDLDEVKTQSASDIAAYFAELEEKEKRAVDQVRTNNVVQLNVEKREPAHTDTELEVESPVDVLRGRLCYDPAAELRAAAFESWLIDDLIPSHGIGFIYGPPGSYKSFGALDMALCVATGKDWHGIEVESPGPAIYIAAEGVRGIQERTVAWKLYHDQPNAPLGILKGAVMMDDPLSVSVLSQMLDAEQERIGQKIRMIVIDTLARSFNGDENSAQEIGAFVNACSRLSSDLGDCFIMIVAHTGKEIARGMRGSSALDGAADCHFLVTKPNDGQALMKNTKQKDVEAAPPMRFAMELVDTGITDRKGRPRRSLVPILESKGEDADPDAEEVDAFDHKDRHVLVGFVKAAQNGNRKISEDELRKQFIDYALNECGKKDAAAKKAWQRAYRAVRDDGRVMKAGVFIYPGSAL